MFTLFLIFMYQNSNRKYFLIRISKLTKFQDFKGILDSIPFFASLHWGRTVPFAYFSNIIRADKRIMKAIYLMFFVIVFICVAISVSASRFRNHQEDANEDEHFDSKRSETEESREKEKKMWGGTNTGKFDYIMWLLATLPSLTSIICNSARCWTYM